MVTKSCYWMLFLTYICNNVGFIFRLQQYCSVTCMCNMADIFIQWHMTVMCNVCIAVHLVTSLIALSSCEACILA